MLQADNNVSRWIRQAVEVHSSRPQIPACKVTGASGCLNRQFPYLLFVKESGQCFAFFARIAHSYDDRRSPRGIGAVYEAVQSERPADGRQPGGKAHHAEQLASW